MAIGWIKLHRNIQESKLWTDEEPFDRRSAWVDLLLMANHEDKKVIIKGQIVTVKRGQRVTSLYKLATRWRWSRDRVRRYLTLLESDNMITRESDSNKTTITIVNYGLFQDTRTTDKTTDNTSDNTSDNTTDNTTDKASDNTTDNTQTRMIKNDKRMIKNEKNEKNEKKKEQRAPRQTYGEYCHVRLTEEEFNRLCNDYGETDTLKAIKILDEYCQESGKTYKDYNLTLRRWPISEAQKGKTTPKSAGAKDLDTLFAEWDQKYGGNNNDKGNI